MRSAILKPDVPPQLFPALKATEDDKQQPSRATAKLSANKLKVGSKRKVSNTGFDEYGDAAIDDADLALAEKVGFEDIDDFDDDLGSSNGVVNKKQKKSDTNEDAAREFEPRQLDNGKWACNHACKEKTSCKHLCCREGLDKKPKPPKPRASKKDNTATDPKQTQLSMSVNKKADTPTASQSTQAQKPGPASIRNPPKGPEFHNISMLHNNVKSNTPQVPLLSRTSASQQKTRLSVAPPNSNGQRRSFNEIAWEVEQSTFSDDFGDLNDFSMNESPVLGQPSTRTNPLLRSDSDLPDIESGRALPSFPSAQEERSRHPFASKAEDETPEWESLFDFGAEDDLFEPRGKDIDGSHRPEGLTDPHVDRHAGPFEDTTCDLTAFDLGCKPQSYNASSYERADDSLGSRPKEQAVLREHFPDASEDSMQSYDKNVLVALQENAVCEAIPTAGMSVEQRPGSSDSATRHFMEELGADLFNYVG